MHLFPLSLTLSRRRLTITPCAMAFSARKIAVRGWREASRQSLIEQTHPMASVVSLYALNPLLFPAAILAALLSLSRKLTRFSVIRTSLYIAALAFVHTIIYSIRSVAPICALYAFYATVHVLILPTHIAAVLPLIRGVTGIVLSLYCLIEVYFYFSQLSRSRQLQQRVTGPPLQSGRRWLTFRRVEQASKFVQPMVMPHSCVYWRKFKQLRNNQTATVTDTTTTTAAPQSTVTVRVADQPLRIRSPTANDARTSTHTHSILSAQSTRQQELQLLKQEGIQSLWPSSSSSSPVNGGSNTDKRNNNNHSQLTTQNTRNNNSSSIVQTAAEDAHPLQFLAGWFLNVSLHISRLTRACLQ